MAAFTQVHDKYVVPLFSPVVFIVFLDYPQCWELDARFHPDADGSDSESEADSCLPPSIAYKEFLRFLELGCRGSPRQGYPALVIVLSTIPHPVRFLIRDHDYLLMQRRQILTCLPSESPLEDLFTSFWSAIDSRAFGMTDKAQTFSVFAHAFVDCLLLFSRRLRTLAPDAVRSLVGGGLDADGTVPGSDTALRDLVRKQTTRFVEEIFQGRLQLDPPAAAKPLSEIVIKLDEVDKGLDVSATFQLPTDCRCHQIYRKLRGNVSQLATSGCCKPRPGQLKSNTSPTSKISSSLLPAHYLKVL